jgi:hypothetical protein
MAELLQPNGIPLTKNLQPKIDNSEHDVVNGVHAKKVIVLGSDGNQFLGGGFNLPAYDELVRTTPTSTTEVYTYKLESTTVATLTVTYTDANKTDISSVVKT